MGPRGARSAPEEGTEAADRAAPQQVRRRVSASARSDNGAIPLRQTRTSTTFPRSHRITRGPELREIARTGKRLRTEHLDVRVSASLSRLGHPRVGFVVPKHGRSAVERNLLKRRLRELTRTTIIPQVAPMDMVIHVRPSAYRLRFDELTSITTTIVREAARIAPKLAAVD